MDQYIGKKIEGRYEITELIGVGGMANVYKAVDVTDGKTVAVKILREEYYSNEELLRRFKNESKAIAMLSHPNIIQVYDVCFSGTMRSIVMEYIDGITLKEYMEQQGKLTWKEAVHFTEQVLRALAHAHEKGIVHRDVKPQNVMLLADGNIKITDFGIARFARSETKTITDRAIGSVHYISPEQARGEHTDQRADLYSVGVMLFEMLTGQLPFEADSPVSVALKQIELEAARPRSINPDIPEGLEEIVVRAMQKDPDDRYQTANEMLEDLHKFKQNPSVVFEYKYLSSEEKQREKYRSAIVAAKGGQKMSKRPSKREEDGEEERRRGSSIIMVLAGVTAAFVIVSGIFIATMLYLNNPFEKVKDVVVPNLVGQSYDSVKDAAQYQDIIIEVESTEFSDLYEKGQIIEQDPKEGRTIKEGSKVKVVVSDGQEIIQVPNLVGMEETAAYNELTRLGLSYTKSEVFSDQAAGTVVSSNPGRGSEVSVGTVVDLQISMGPEDKIATVPDVTGRTLDEAKALIRNAGLQVGGISYVTSDEPEGTVVSQDPLGDSQVATDGLVNLNVSAGDVEMQSVQLAVPLPPGEDDIVKLQAMVDGSIVRQEQVQPSAALYWRPSFEGHGTTQVTILYNEFLYQIYSVDFDNESSQLIEDHSNEYQ